MIAKRGAIVGAKAITLGALDAEDEIRSAVAELAGGTADDIVGAFKKERDLLDTFKQELTDAVDQLGRAKGSSLV